MPDAPPTRPVDLLNPAVSQWSLSAGPLTQALPQRDTGETLLALLVAGALPERGPLVEALSMVGLDVEQVRQGYAPKGDAGALASVPVLADGRRAGLVLLAGSGSGDPADLREAGAALGRAARGRERLVVALPEGTGEPALAALAEGLALGGYTPPRWSGGEGTDSRVDAPVRSVALVGAAGTDQTVRRAVARARATMVARGLAVAPSNIKSPQWLAEQAVALAEASGLAARVWDDAELREQGFGGLLAVGGGSATPPRLVQLDHTPAGGGSDGRVVLVGKGITFDTGGLNIKPADGMGAMKTDMSGAGVVLAVLAACRELGVQVPVTGLLPLAENAVGGSSYRPGDVITQYGGRTVEIGNTDAEGRLVLADALAYADEHLDPAVLVDVATLTGAARVALARSMAPVYATDDVLRRALVAAGEAAGELLWPFPLVEDYRAGLDSDVADINHIASKPFTGGGSITAALFLREFTGGRPWAHLDIAGVGRSDVDRGLLSKGGTGFGARLLLTWLEEQR